MKKITMIIILAIGASYGKANAQTGIILSDKTGWHSIGETTVDFKKDSDEVNVIIADKFAALKFKVEDAPIDLMSMTVYYESGDHQHVKIDTQVKAEGESRVIDLNGGERSIKKIVFVYKTLPNRKDEKAHVEIWGMKTNADENYKK